MCLETLKDLGTSWIVDYGCMIPILNRSVPLFAAPLGFSYTSSSRLSDIFLPFFLLF